MIILDTMGRRPREGRVNPKLAFRFEACWAHNKEAKLVIKEAWDRGGGNVLEKIRMTRAKLGTWQHNQYNTNKRRISRLVREIDQMIDGPRNDTIIEELHKFRVELRRQYNAEETYWS